MKRDEKLLNYCNRRKLPFTINLADLNDRAKLGYISNGKRCSGLSKLLQKLASAGRLDYEGILGKGVMIRSVSLPDELSNVKSVPDMESDRYFLMANIHKDVGKVFGVVESLSVQLRAISDLMDDDNCPAVIAKLDSTVDKMFNRQLQMEDTLTKVVSHVETISRHIGGIEVNE